ncbi:MAG: peptidylprolyl isomerase [Salinibacter sp.]
MRTWLLFLVALWWTLPVGAQPLPDRADDQLLSTPSLQAVAEAQLDRDTAALRQALQSDTSSVQARAAFGLASVPDTAAIPTLTGLLNHGVPAVRTDAAFALAQMPTAAAADALLDALRFARHTEMQRLLIHALGNTGDAPSLRALLDMGLPPARDADVALALARYGMRGVVDSVGSDWLADRLTAEDDWARRNAAYAVGRVDSLATGRWDTIRGALDDYAFDDPAAMHLLQALGRADDTTDTDRIADWLDTPPDWRTRVAAAQALASRTTHAPARTALLDALDDDHPLVARAAAETLAEATWTTEHTSRVRTWIADHPDRWRIVAPLLHGRARNEDTARVLSTVEDWRTDRGPVPYAAALPALAPLDTARADTLLDAALRHEDVRVAAGAVEAVVARWEQRRPDGATPTFRRLTTATQRGDPALLYRAAPALTDSAFASMGAADTLASVYRTLDTPADLEGMTAILDALGTLGADTAESVLRDALDHPHHAVRQAAAQGLSQMRDTTIAAAPTPLPDPPSLDWDALQDLGPHPQLVLETNRGPVTIELDTEQAPQTVQAITQFARDGRYDGVPFHRVVPNFVVQGGDFARRTGFGGPGVFLRTEITRLGHRRGTLGMASAGKDTEGSQFFVPHSLQPHLDGRYTSFGRVTDGMDVVDRLRVHDRITDARVVPTRNR